MLVAPIPVGARLVDGVSIAPSDCAALKAAGNDGIFGYLGGNLTPALVEAALAVNLGVCPVNFSRGDPWTPSASLGAHDAQASTAALAALAVPTAGLVDWCDLEGVSSDPTDYLNAWSLVVATNGRLAGLYVAAGSLLTGAQLGALPRFTRYWRSLSNVPEPTPRGFCLVQLYPTSKSAGVEVDFDFAQQDYGGGSATWIVSG
jgi:hypothetical protein